MQVGLAGVSRRKFVVTTVKGDSRQAPDLVERNFAAEAPDRLWVADITYIPTWAGFLYLAVVLDAYSRRIVGWSMATTLATQLVLDALNMALLTRRPTGVIHHSDQGSQAGLKWSSQHDLCWPVGRHRNCPPHCITVTVTGSDLDEFFSIAGYHRKHAIRRRSFRRCWWPNLDKHSAVLGLVQDEPALRAGAASGILDKASARRSVGEQVGSEEWPSLSHQGMQFRSWIRLADTRSYPKHYQFRTSLDMADISNWSSASAGVCQASVFRGLALRAAATA
jgi:hypothetical protein